MRSAERGSPQQASFDRRGGEHSRFRRKVQQIVVMLGVVLIGFSCASGTGSAGRSNSESNQSVVSPQDSRRVVGEFADIQGVALSRRLVFALSSSGIAVYDRVFNRWERSFPLPVAMRGSPVTAMSADVTEDAVWFGMPGAVHLYRPRTQSLESAVVPGTPTSIVFDTRNPLDALLTVDGQWFRISRTGLVTSIGPGLPAGTVLTARNNLADVYQKFPSLRNQLLSLFRETRADRPSTLWTAVSGAVAPDRASEVWLGTNGGGLWKVDPTFQSATPLRYGLGGNEATAMVSTGDGVWVAASDRNRRVTLSFVTNDLQNWRTIDGTMSVPMTNLRVRDLALRGEHLWMATDRGVIIASLDGKTELISVTTTNGLPSNEVYAVWPLGDRTFVGTASGLTEITDAVGVGRNHTHSAGRRWVDGIAVYALQAGRNGVTVGTSDGLYEYAGGLHDLPSLQRNNTFPHVPVRALAQADSQALFATDDAVFHLVRENGGAPMEIAGSMRQLGTVSSLAADDRSIFIASANGLLTSQRNSPSLRKFLAAGIDLPIPIHDVAISRDWVWLATSGGLVRLARLPDGSIR